MAERRSSAIRPNDSPLTLLRGPGLLASMRTTLVLSASLTLLALAGGCNRGEPAATPATPGPAAVAPATPPGAAAVAPAAPGSSAAALPSAATAAPLAAAPAAGGTPTRYGAPLSAAPAITVQAVLADPKQYDDKDIKLTGQVGGVCQNKGCWMTVGTGEPGAASIRVRFKDYAFFVPRDCIGKTAVVEGRFKLTTLSVAEAQHYADDAAKAGAAPKKITAPQATLAMMATGVELL